MRQRLQKVRADKMKKLGVKECVLGRNLQRDLRGERMVKKGVDCTDNC